MKIWTPSVVVAIWCAYCVGVAQMRNDIASVEFQGIFMLINLAGGYYFARTR